MGIDARQNAALFRPRSVRYTPLCREPEQRHDCDLWRRPDRRQADADRPDCEGGEPVDDRLPMKTDPVGVKKDRGAADMRYAGSGGYCLSRRLFYLTEAAQAETLRSPVRAASDAA